MIRDLTDALALIEGRKDFVVKRDPAYVAIDYAVAFPDTFEDARRGELRGMKFYPDTGEIMARPLHKFFNVGEREDTQPHLLDFDADHTIMDKLDGSMIHPALLRDGSVRFMTRMGITDVARKAERHLTPELRAHLEAHLGAGYTPVFEFTAPDNRIVVRYASSGLTLLALRCNASGAYAPRTELERLGELWGVPVVRTWERPTNATAFIETVRTIKGAEGVVIRFASGLWVKIKGEEYATMHKAKDAITREKNVLAVILDGVADDLRPLLSQEDRAAVDAYETRLAASFAETCALIEGIVDSGAALDQKTFAVEHVGKEPAWVRSLTFAVRGGKPAMTALRSYLRKHCGTQTEVDSVRHLLGTTWDMGAMVE